MAVWQSSERIRALTGVRRPQNPVAIGRVATLPAAHVPVTPDMYRGMRGAVPMPELDASDVLDLAGAFDKVLADDRARRFKPSAELEAWVHRMGFPLPTYAARAAVAAGEENGGRNRILIGIDMGQPGQPGVETLYFTASGLGNEISRHDLETLGPDGLDEAFIATVGVALPGQPYQPTMARAYQITTPMAA